MESDESDGSFPPWVSLEYTQMLTVAHPSPVIFSSLSSQSVNSLRTLLTTSSTNSPAVEKSSFSAESKSVGELMKERSVGLGRVCLLDPKATKELCPADREEFDWFL